jgi:hypothetical protein
LAYIQRCSCYAAAVLALPYRLDVYYIICTVSEHGGVRRAGGRTDAAASSICIFINARGLIAPVFAILAFARLGPNVKTNEGEQSNEL